MSLSEIGKTPEIATNSPVETTNFHDAGKTQTSGLEKLDVNDINGAQASGMENNPQSETTRINTINSGLEGKEHPKTDIPFGRDTVELPDGRVVEGVFPEFKPVAEVQMNPNETGDYKGTRQEHETAANKGLQEQVANNPELQEKFTPEQLDQIEHGETPDDYTWHHNQEPGKMQLVDTKIHDATAHTGGYSIWGKDS
ncbi:hypothetical protein FACS1894187_14790 [Synergistales bacterium]|nr:hypothetical protein FACS1894187_14790 [Synergistales bacterium]